MQEQTQKPWNLIERGVPQDIIIGERIGGGLFKNAYKILNHSGIILLELNPLGHNQIEEIYDILLTSQKTNANFPVQILFSSLNNKKTYIIADDYGEILYKKNNLEINKKDTVELLINLIKLSNSSGISCDNHDGNLTFNTTDRLRVIDLCYSRNSIQFVLDNVDQNKNVVEGFRWIKSKISYNPYISYLCQKPANKLSKKEKNSIIKFLKRLIIEKKFMDSSKDREFVNSLPRSF